MSDDAHHRWWHVPGEPLVEVTEQIVEALPVDPRDQHRQIAVRWLHELDLNVHAWNRGFIEFLKKYPGFKDEKRQGPYKAFFEELLVYRRQLDDRHEDVKRSLCAPLKHLHAKFPDDFAWLRAENPERYDWLYGAVTNAYRNETGIIGAAQMVIEYICAWESQASWVDPELRVSKREFLKWHAEHYLEKVQLINEYETESALQARRIRDIAEKAQVTLSSLEEINAHIKGIPVANTPRTIRTTTTTTRTPQQDHPPLYNLLAFAFGIIFVAALLVIAVVIPSPTLFQVRVFTSVLAVALAGASAVITGILNVQAKLGTQFAIGASGALAVFVIVYLINPAVLT